MREEGREGEEGRSTNKNGKRNRSKKAHIYYEIKSKQSQIYGGLEERLTGKEPASKKPRTSSKIETGGVKAKKASGKGAGKQKVRNKLQDRNRRSKS